MLIPIAIGDVVILKSGGPRMTVQTIEDGAAICLWFQRDEKRTGGFQLSSLTRSGSLRTFETESEEFGDNFG